MPTPTDSHEPHPDTPESLAARIMRRFGESACPDVSLHAAEERDQAESNFSSALVARLSDRGGSFGRYRVKGEIARGGMGAILKIWDDDLHRHLAMKVILGQVEGRPREGGAPPGGQEARATGGADTPPIETRKLARFLEEAQVTGQLDHPGIVPVHELGLDPEGRVYFTMKLVRGRSLKEVFDLVAAGKEGWSQTKALGVLLKVCEAMAYAHDKGVIHRDLKPANVMVGKFGEVHVMDWGLARILGRKDERDLRIREELTPTSTHLRSQRDEHRGKSPESPLYTMDGDVIGTPGYMPPEQAAGRVSEMGPHSDVYALGAMLYHLLAGHMPYVPKGARLNIYAIWGLVQQGPPTPIAQLAGETPAELVAICEKAMARDWKHRYRDMSALAADLAAYLEHRVVGAHQTGRWAEAKKWVERNRPLAVTLAAAVVILVTGIVASTTFAVDAQKQATRADEKTVETNRLKDEALAQGRELRVRGLIQDLVAFESLDDSLDYARRQNRPAYEWWLEHAHLLIDGCQDDTAKDQRWKPGLADVEAQLAKVRAHQTSRFADSENEWWNDQLARLVLDLHRLRDRIAVAERSVKCPEASELWKEAIAAIASSPKYGGLRLTPQIGLWPIGADPESGLWEFAHLPTGEPAVRAWDGKLMLKPEMGLVFVLLPGGRVPVEDGARPTPVNEVDLESFFLSKYEMTTQQWSRVTNWTGRFFYESVAMFPANTLCWDDCQATLGRVDAWVWLPTEAQWEYGCRAGTLSPWWTGKAEDSLKGAANIDFVAEVRKYANLQLLGQLRANGFGLHDVHGNIWEWCRDGFGGSEVPVRSGDGEHEVSDVRYRVIRGGGSGIPALSARSGFRDYGMPGNRDGNLGLRPARGITP